MDSELEEGEIVDSEEEETTGLNEIIVPPPSPSLKIKATNVGECHESRRNSVEREKSFSRKRKSSRSRCTDSDQGSKSRVAPSANKKYSKNSSKLSTISTEPKVTFLKESVLGTPPKRIALNELIRHRSTNLVPPSPINNLSGKGTDQQFENSIVSVPQFKSPDDFEIAPTRGSSPCHSPSIIDCSPDNSAEFIDDVNALNESVVSLLPSPTVSQPLHKNSEEVGHSPSPFRRQVNIKPVFDSLPSPSSLPDLRNNLNARYGFFGNAKHKQTNRSPNIQEFPTLQQQGFSASASSIRDNENGKQSKCDMPTDYFLRNVVAAPLLIPRDINPPVTLSKRLCSPNTVTTQEVRKFISPNPKDTQSLPSTPVLHLDDVQRCKEKQYPKKRTFQNFKRTILNEPGNKTLSLPGKDSCLDLMEDNLIGSSSTKRIFSSTGTITVNNTNQYPASLPTNFDVALDAMLKSARGLVEANSSSRMSSDKIIQTSLQDTFGKSRESSACDSCSKRTREELIGLPNPRDSLFPGMSMVRKKEELELREKLLKSALMRKRNNSQLVLQLAAAEKKLINTRSTATEMFVKLHSSMVNYKEKSIYYRQLNGEVDKLRGELEAAEKRIQITKKSAKLLAEEVRQSSKISFTFRNKCTELMKNCSKIGKEVKGPQYKLPAQGESKLKDILERVRQQSTFMKKFNEKISKPVFPSTSRPAPEVASKEVPFPVDSVRQSTELPAPTTTVHLRTATPPYRIDVQPTKEQDYSARILTEIHFIDVLTSGEGSKASVSVLQVVGLPSELALSQGLKGRNTCPYYEPYEPFIIQT